MSENIIQYNMACPWQKVIITQKKVFEFEVGSCITDEITTTVKFGNCMTNCPFYDVIGNYCRRINKND